MKKTPLKKVSDKTRERNIKWAKIRLEKIQEQIKERGYAYCEECNMWGYVDLVEGVEFKYLDAHHKDWRRSNCTKENCKICHRICHERLHLSNIKEE